MPRKTFVQEMRELKAQKQREMAAKLLQMIKEGKIDKDNIKWAEAEGGEWNADIERQQEMEKADE